MVVSRPHKKTGSNAEPGIHAPATVAANTPAAPISDASRTFPLRIRYIHRATKRAIGIVQTIVKAPHELPGIFWTLDGTVTVAPDSTATPSGIAFLPFNLMVIGSERKSGGLLGP